MLSKGRDVFGALWIALGYSLGAGAGTIFKVKRESILPFSENIFTYGQPVLHEYTDP